MTDPGDFTELIKEHEAIIYKIASVYTDNNIDLQDLYQEVVIQLWSARKKFRNEARVSTWIYRIALNTAITRLRKEKKQGVKVPIDREVLNYTDTSDPIMEARVKALYKNIEKLSDLDKGIMLLLLEDKSYDEIAEIIGISSSNVGTRLSRIKAKLKNQMNPKPL